MYISRITVHASLFETHLRRACSTSTVFFRFFQHRACSPISPSNCPTAAVMSLLFRLHALLAAIAAASSTQVATLQPTATAATRRSFARARSHNSCETRAHRWVHVRAYRRPNRLAAASAERHRENCSFSAQPTQVRCATVRKPIWLGNARQMMRLRQRRRERTTHNRMTRRWCATV